MSPRSTVIVFVYNGNDVINDHQEFPSSTHKQTDAHMEGESNDVMQSLDGLILKCFQLCVGCLVFEL